MLNWTAALGIAAVASVLSFCVGFLAGLIANAPESDEPRNSSPYISRR